MKKVVKSNMASFYAQLVVENPPAEEATELAAPKVRRQRTIKSKAKKIKEEKVKPKRYGKIVGMIGASVIYANSKVGQYTGNRLQTTNTNTLLGLGVAVGVGILSGHPAIAAVGTGLTLAKGAIDLEINQINSSQQSTYKRSLIGSPTTSGSRWGGKYN